MSKLLFRARALDASKSMPVYKAEDIPDLPDFAAINRAVPQMPTGMEKEEETEHHLQAALSAQQAYGTAQALVIPVPDIDDVDEHYNGLYGLGAQGYKPPKAYIHVQPWGMDQEIPDYDMDSGDESWLNKQSKKLEVNPLKFETMMDRLEKGSGQKVMSLQEAKALLKEDDDLIIAVYDYWLNKRLKYKKRLIPSVQTEKRDGSTTNNPYVAFRRRTEKMQTRKNRKNDEASYERMLKMKRDLKQVMTTLELVKRREKSKKELVKLQIEISEKRYQMEDWDGKAYGEALAKRHTLPPTYVQPILQLHAAASSQWQQRDEVPYTKKAKREYKKHRRQHKQSSAAANAAANAAAAREARVPQLPQYNDVDIMGPADLYSSEDDIMSPPMSASDHEVDDDPDGVYAFRRKPGVFYHAPINNGFGNWPWHGPDEGGIGEAKYRFSLTSLPRHRKPAKRCIGFARRRIGRGGRVILDRVSTDWDEHLHHVDFTPDAEETGWGCDYQQYVRENHIHHFRPKTPTEEEEEQASRYMLGQPSGSSISPALSTEFNVESFQNHQEQLLQMQRHQQEQLLTQDTLSTPLATSVDISLALAAASSSGQSTSKFLLDSAKAAFAVSAVHNSATELIHATPTTLTVSSSSSGAITNSMSETSPLLVTSVDSTLAGGLVDTATAAASGSALPAVKPVAVQHNGPTIDNTNVLQLNYPLTTTTSSSSSLSAPSSAPSVQHRASGAAVMSTPFVTSATTSLLASSGQTQQNTVFSKLAAVAASTQNTAGRPQKEKHDGSANGNNSLLKDKVMPMEVT